MTLIFFEVPAMKRLFIAAMCLCFTLGGTVAYAFHANKMTITYQIVQEKPLLDNFSDSVKNVKPH